ncbi:MAG: amidohydrolase family protein [Solobacterium sp.]|nr:amidohydrolase family protein [Solobacterium sp.]
MKFDFSQENFYDNHTHVLDMDKPEVSVDWFIKSYNHGPMTSRDETGAKFPSEKHLGTIRELPMLLMLTHFMAERFGCEETIEAVVEARNHEIGGTEEGIRKYMQALYDEEHIVSSTLESELPMGDPLTLCIPNHVNRLFRFEDVYFSLLKSEVSFASLMEKLKKSIVDAKAAGFVGIKGHIAEKCGMDAYLVTPEEAEHCFHDARAGDREAFRAVYYCMFDQILYLTGELGMSFHIHTGSTGMRGTPGVHKHDPALLAPFLLDGRHENADIVMLHGGFPYTRQAALMAYNFPNIYIDFSQTLPWQGMGFAAMLKEVIGQAPHNRIMLGSGQHGAFEAAWAASKASKTALARIMEELVDDGLISEERAVRSARQILSENARRLYGEIE